MNRILYALLIALVVSGCASVAKSTAVESNTNSDTLYFANDVQLSNDEQKADKLFSAYKNEVLLNLSKNNISLYNSSFTQLRPFIESSSLYKLLKTMPKGALLHTHSGGTANPSWIIQAAAKYNNCYVYTGSDTKDFIYGQLSFFQTGKIANGFVSLQQFLQENKQGADTLRKLLTLNRNTLSEHIDYWIEFEKRFKRIGMLLSYRPFFKEYYKESFTELLKDNVQHVEIRYIFGNLFDEYNASYPVDTVITELNEIATHIKKDTPSFSYKLIYTSFKFFDTTAVLQQLNSAFQLKKKYPEIIKGFDLVADEATGNSVGYFQKIWEMLPFLEKQYGVTMPLYLHAGESCTTANTNILDIPLRQNRRIGHGLNMVYFPGLMQRVKASDNLVEVNPISNQELGYVSDLRNHPARVLMANGIQCSISSDDPGVFGYDGLSYDFWVAYMNWDLNLKGIKKLVFNSVNYSSLSKVEKNEAISHLQNEWNMFIATAIK